MKKIYKLSSGLDVSLTVEVDLEKLTPALAAEINDFWSGADDVLRAAGGDVVEAAVRRAFPSLISYAFDGWNSLGMVSRLEEQEGWPGEGWGGIRVLDVDIPDLDSDGIEVEVLA